MHKCQVKPGERQNFYSVEAAAAYLTIGTTTIYKAVQQRQLKHTRFGQGKIIRISHESLCSWVEEQTKPTLDEVKLEALRREKMAITNRRPKKASGRKTPIQKKNRIRHRWPPATITDLQILAHRIEEKMMADESQ